MWLQILFAATVSGAGSTKSVNSSASDPYEPRAVHAADLVQRSTSTNDLLSPFATDEPSRSLFKRKDGLGVLAPIINIADNLLGKPIPTNEWWGNLIHAAGGEVSDDTVADPVWSNPYALKLPNKAPFGLQACYSYTYRQLAEKVDGVIRYYLHEFHNDLTLSASEFGSTKPDYQVYSYSDMGVNIRTCVSGKSTSNLCMDSALVHGMAFVSATYAGLTPRIESDYAMTVVDRSTPGKYVMQLANKQTWVVFTSDTSASFSIAPTGSALVASAAYTGTIRLAVLPESGDPSVYDNFASCVVRGGQVSVQSRTRYSFEWETEGSGCDSTGMLHFALPHQVEVMTRRPTTAQSRGAIVLHSSTRGQMVGQVTKPSSWTLSEPETDDEVDFYPLSKLSASAVSKVKLLSTLQSDIDSKWKLDAGSWYYDGKAYQKYASLCLVAADRAVVGDDKTLLKRCVSKLEALVGPFVNNTLGMPLVYDTTYKGIVTSQVFDTKDVCVEFGNGVFNDHHYHYGYWVTASAILKKLDPSWSGMAQLETMVWTLLRDVANPSSDDVYFPKFRHFSWFVGHSYSHGVTSVTDGKDEESTSEDVNFFYGMKLWGKVTANRAVEDLGSLMLRLNARAVRTYFLMTSDSTIHPSQFVPNHVTGIFFDNKVDYATWFSAEKHCIHGIQMIPVSPINGLARTATFVKEEWDDVLSLETIVKSNNVTNAWLSLLLVNAAVIDQEGALEKLATATMDDGLTRSWALYNAASRGSARSSTHAARAPPTKKRATFVASATRGAKTARSKVTAATSKHAKKRLVAFATSKTWYEDTALSRGSPIEIVDSAPSASAALPPSSSNSATSRLTVTNKPSKVAAAQEKTSTGSRIPGWTSTTPGWTSYTPGVVKPERSPTVAVVSAHLTTKDEAAFLRPMSPKR
ncbi:unnamed protein product [Hyaloperonospora brassicae]|uniref:glucan endo-1,3-beta-D-glucosidase n=1 Tax=Hyaloperonospora brassicae TaxID=162125 RepID=A0AAV0T1C5_HYABA|nr:unnamed protein product [Hyaloperonospora brassicae]